MWKSMKANSFRSSEPPAVANPPFSARAHADETLARIGLKHVADSFPMTLSGGRQQRLAIGQALTAKPSDFLLDEPFGALDPGARLSTRNFLQERRTQTGMTAFMVTHDLKEAFKQSDRVLVFDKPRWDPHDPSRYGATITCDFDARESGIPYQKIKENTHVAQEYRQIAVAPSA